MFTAATNNLFSLLSDLPVVFSVSQTSEKWGKSPSQSIKMPANHYKYSIYYNVRQEKSSKYSHLRACSHNILSIYALKLLSTIKVVSELLTIDNCCSLTYVQMERLKMMIQVFSSFCFLNKFCFNLDFLWRKTSCAAFVPLSNFTMMW